MNTKYCVQEKITPQEKEQAGDYCGWLVESVL
jgi:hypothetical protein